MDEVRGLLCYRPQEAIQEAWRCLVCQDAPCTQACPASVDVMHFIRAIRFEGFRRALAIIRRNNPLAGICGVVCPKERLCEGACLQKAVEQPIRIGALQAFAAAYDMSVPLYSDPEPLPEASGPAVAVVGAGPAGVSCAHYLRRRGVQVTLFDARKEPGGMLVYGVPQRRMPLDFVKAELSWVLRGVDLRMGVSLGTDLDVDSLLGNGFSAVVLGMGLWRPGRLPVFDGMPGVHTALEFLEATARHQKFGANAPEVGGRVVVVGGGSVAMDCAECALDLGAEEVEVVCLENTDEMPATHEDVRKAWDRGVRFYNRRRVTGSRQSNERIAVDTIGIEWKEDGLYVPSNAVDVPGTEASLLADYVVVAIGQLRHVELSDVGIERGAVFQDDSRTPRKGLYVAGDYGGLSGGTVVGAVASGRKVACSVLEDLGIQAEVWQ